MTLNAVLVIVGFVVFFIVSIRFIVNNGGWQSGCKGDCSECKEKCESQAKRKHAKRGE